jgi:hypothetical protein
MSHGPDITLAVRQLQWVMFEFWLGSAMIVIGFTGITMMAYQMLRRYDNGQD